MPTFAVTLGQEAAERVRDFSESAGRPVSDVLLQGVSQTTGHSECDIGNLENQGDGGLTFGITIEGQAAAALADQAREHNTNESAHVAARLNNHFSM